MAGFLRPEDIVNLSQTCRRLRSILPDLMILHGKDFYKRGPSLYHDAPDPTIYFDSPKFRSAVKSLSVSVTWVDQGWGNMKGKLGVLLLRPSEDDEPKQIARHNTLGLGTAEHTWTSPKSELIDDSIVTLSEKGDFYRFIRNIGQGGGHTLEVKNFIAVLTFSSSFKRTSLDC